MPVHRRSQLSPFATLFAAMLAAVSITLCLPAWATTLRIGSQGDVLSMDPHSLNEGVQLSVLGNVFEPLVTRDRNFKLSPALATDWAQTAPTVWRFHLRRGVLFHDGTPFNADDVIFSFERAASPGSDMHIYVDPIREIRKIDDYTIDIVTRRPLVILPDTLVVWFMMSKKWCEANRATAPVDRRKGIENAASFRANGTGPYRLRERQPDVGSKFSRNGRYWGKVEGNVDEVQFNVIGNDASRVAALLSGEVDVIDPLSLQDAARVARTPGFAALQAPELRVIYLGMDQKRDELLFSNVKGRNPFKDKRVRQAFYQAIDVEGIKHHVMHDAAIPIAEMFPPQVRGFAPDLNKRLPFDPRASKTLLAQAGYPDGFEVTMNCPNDRYLNDAAICQTVAANLARVGVTVKLDIESKSRYFPKVLRRDTSFYLIGWTAPTWDALSVILPVMASPGGPGQGNANLGGYSNPRIDELAALIGAEVDESRRNAMIHEVIKIHQDDIGHIPLHQQTLSWGRRKGVTLVQTPSGAMPWRYARISSDAAGRP